MQRDNICKFVPSFQNAPIDVNTVNFVLESSDVGEKEGIRSVYSLFLITRGSGELVLDDRHYDLEKGNLFLILPSARYSIRAKQDLEYAYVSFLGVGAPILVQRLTKNGVMKIFEGTDGLIAYWKQALAHAHPKNIDLISKGVLEYSTALLIDDVPQESATKSVVRIEQYIRRNFTLPGIRLHSVAKQFGYSEKYLSKLFLRHTGMHFGEYLTNLRINAACGLMQERQSSVKEVAFACGFTDPLYFSKVFKVKMGVTPSAFLQESGANIFE